MNTQEKNLYIISNQRFFKISLIEITDIIKNKSIELEQHSKNKIVHQRLQKECEKLKLLFSDVNENQGVVMKKFYKIVVSNFDKIYPEPQNELFSIKNDKNQIVTLFPGIDVSIIIKHFDKETTDLFWDYLYMMCISVIIIMSTLNDKAKKNLELVPKLRVRVNKSGLILKTKLFNPYIPNTSTEHKKISTQTFIEDAKNDKLIPDGENNNLGMMSLVQSLMSGNGVINEESWNKMLDGIETYIPDDTMIGELLGKMGIVDSEVTSAFSEIITSAMSELKNTDVKDRSLTGLISKLSPIMTSGLEKNKNIFEKTGQTLSNNIESGTNPELANIVNNASSIINDESLEGMDMTNFDAGKLFGIASNIMNKIDINSLTKK